MGTVHEIFNSMSKAKQEVVYITVGLMMQDSSIDVTKAMYYICSQEQYTSDELKVIRLIFEAYVKEVHKK